MTSHLRADCIETRISSGPNARIEYGITSTLTFTFRKRTYQYIESKMAHPLNLCKSNKCKLWRTNCRFAVPYDLNLRDTYRQSCNFRTGLVSDREIIAERYASYCMQFILVTRMLSPSTPTQYS